MNELANRTVLPSPGWRDRLLAAFWRRGWRGFLTLHRLLKPSAARREVQTVTCYGSQFHLKHGDEIDARVLSEGFYESEVLEAVLPFLGPNAVLWVVGANFGLHAITAKCLHPEARVVAFEPHPALGARVIENCDLNRVEIDFHAYALSGRTGTLPFFADAPGNPGMSTLHPVEGFDYRHRIHVAAATAADVVAQGMAPAPTALIIDAEGAELDVLRGFGAHLAAPGLRVVVFETLNDFLKTREPAELDSLLRAAGFSCRVLARREQTAHALSNFAATRP